MRRRAGKCGVLTRFEVGRPTQHCVRNGWWGALAASDCVRSKPPLVGTPPSAQRSGPVPRPALPLRAIASTRRLIRQRILADEDVLDEPADRPLQHSRQLSQFDYVNSPLTRLVLAHPALRLPQSLRDLLLGKAKFGAGGNQPTPKGGVVSVVLGNRRERPMCRASGGAPTQGASTGCRIRDHAAQAKPVMGWPESSG